MDSLNNVKTSSSINPNFEVIIAFDYYDGPESGLAIYATGEGIRFSSVGDSKSRLQRGFLMEAVEGDWWPHVQELMKAEGISNVRRLIWPKGPSRTLAGLEEKVAVAIPKERFVAVCKIDMSQLISAPVGAAEVSRLRELDGSPAGFRFANALVRRRMNFTEPRG